MIKVKSRSIILLSSKNLKSLLEQISEPFPQPSQDRIAELSGLIDGNKRSAVLLLGVFYELNGRELVISDEKIATYAVMVSSIKTSQITVEDKVRFLENEFSTAK